MDKFFVIADPHGFYNEVMDALSVNGFDVLNESHKLVVLGDLLDRGPGAVQLYDFVRSLGKRFIYIRGNHEDLLLECVNMLGTDLWGTPFLGHHISNQTVNTIAQFMDYNEKVLLNINKEDQFNVKQSMSIVTDWIKNKSVNYYEIGNYIFVHSYIPTITDNKLPPYYTQERSYSYDPGWRSATERNWETARWGNPFEIWKQDIKEPGKTIVCGHWHSSYYWSHIKQLYKEFPKKTSCNWLLSFQPAIDDGIIGLDACTAYSGICNCLVLDL